MAKFSSVWQKTVSVCIQQKHVRADKQYQDDYPEHRPILDYCTFQLILDIALNSLGTFPPNMKQKKGRKTLQVFQD